jgi:hypothetical protein
MEPIRYRCYACGKILSLDKPSADVVRSRGLPVRCAYCSRIAGASGLGGSGQGTALPAHGPQAAQPSAPAPPEQA